jgi:hypothetical protein
VVSLTPRPTLPQGMEPPVPTGRAPGRIWSLCKTETSLVPSRNSPLYYRLNFAESDSSKFRVMTSQSTSLHDDDVASNILGAISPFYAPSCNPCGWLCYSSGGLVAGYSSDLCSSCGQRYSTFFLRVPPHVISLQLCTPKAVGV